MPNNPPWSTEEIEQLRILWNEFPHLNAVEIGYKLSRPRNSVLGRVFRMRAKEGEERWPQRAYAPKAIYKTPRAPRKAAHRPKFQLKQKPRPVESPPEPDVEKVVIPQLPDRVIARPSMRCQWVDCTEQKVRGSYCADHARIVYLPREARR